MVQHDWHHSNHGKDPIGPKGTWDLVEHLKGKLDMFLVKVVKATYSCHGASGLTAGHPNVHYVNLMNNELGDEGAKAIGELLKENKGIVELVSLLIGALPINGIWLTYLNPDHSVA